jgi:hypothetical protein
MRVIICKQCTKEHKTESYNSIYCSTQCQQDYRFKLIYEDWLIGKPVTAGVKRFKKFVKKRDKYECSVCKISEWNNKEIVLEMEHKDGNSENNHPDNLCLICPNCHSQTDTYKAKNVGNGRHSRRQRYAEGKSF